MFTKSPLLLMACQNVFVQCGAAQKIPTSGHQFILTKIFSYFTTEKFLKNCEANFRDPLLSGTSCKLTVKRDK